MKFHPHLKTLAACTLATLTLSAGAAQAEGRSCLLNQTPQTIAPIPASPGQDVRSDVRPDTRQQMARIDQAMRNGQITPFEAGQLMRQQWEIAQFQRGFLNGDRPERKSSCGLGSDLGASLAPIGSMAVSGMQTASSLMRTLMQEADRLIREQAATDGSAL